MSYDKYAYGVARVRSNELTLLSASDLEQLISAPGYKDTLRLLGDKGWQLPAEDEDVSSMLEREMAAVWGLFKESAPDIEELYSLVVYNDFHNLKAALKAALKGERTRLWVEPCINDPETLTDAVFERKYEYLPDYMREAAEKAYDAVVRLSDARQADVILDIAALQTAVDFAKKSDCPMIVELARFFAAASNVRTAVRSARNGKGAEYITQALCPSCNIDNDELVKTVLAGEEELSAFITRAFSEKAAAALNNGLVAFEKWADENMAAIVSGARYSNLTPEPFAAYYIHKELDVKNVRIILSAKNNLLDADTIRARVRTYDA